MFKLKYRYEVFYLSTKVALCRFSAIATEWIKTRVGFEPEHVSLDYRNLCRFDYHAFVVWQNIVKNVIRFMVGISSMDHKKVLKYHVCYFSLQYRDPFWIAEPL